MSAISPFSRLVAVLRAQRSSGLEEPPKSEVRAGEQLPEAHRAAAALGSAVASLGPRLLALSKQDPARRQKALRMLVEATLLDNFGQQNAATPAFQEVVDRAARTIETEPELQALLTEALQELLD